MPMRFLAILFLACSAKATISANAQWNVQNGGAATNGGFFVTGASGTDYSLQNGAQFSVTDAVTAGTSTITSATANFTSAIVGNGCYIQGGTAPITAGWYEVVTFTNSTTIVVDRATGLDAGTGATLNCGGALDLPKTAVDATNSNLGTIWVKNGTYTQTAAFTIDSTINYKLFGYNTTQGDITLSSQLTRPLITTATNSVHLWDIGGALTDGLTLIKNFRFTNTAATRGFGIYALTARASIAVENCSFDGFSTAFQGNFAIDWNWNWLELRYVEIKNSTGDAIFNSGNGTGNNFTCHWCYIHDNGGHGVNWDDGFADISNSIFASNTGSGFYADGDIGYFRSYNSNYVSNTVSGVDISNGSGTMNPGLRYTNQLVNNIFYGNGAYGVNKNSTDRLDVNYFNAYGNNTTANRNNFSAGVGDVSLSASPFTSATDFSLNSNAAGNSLKNAGFPGTIVTSTGYNSIGAIAPNASANTSTIGTPTGN